MVSIAIIAVEKVPLLGDCIRRTVHSRPRLPRSGRDSKYPGSPLLGAPGSLAAAFEIVSP